MSAATGRSCHSPPAAPTSCSHPPAPSLLPKGSLGVNGRYDLMRMCWAYERRDRPTFFGILNHILRQTQLHPSFSDYFERVPLGTDGSQDLLTGVPGCRCPSCAARSAGAGWTGRGRRRWAPWRRRRRPPPPPTPTRPSRRSPVRRSPARPSAPPTGGWAGPLPIPSPDRPPRMPPYDPHLPPLSSNQSGAPRLLRSRFPRLPCAFHLRAHSLTGSSVALPYVWLLQLVICKYICRTTNWFHLPTNQRWLFV